MAVTLTVEELAQELRISTGTARLPEPLAGIMSRLLGACSEMVETYAPLAPDSHPQPGLCPVGGIRVFCYPNIKPFPQPDAPKRGASVVVSVQGWAGRGRGGLTMRKFWQRQERRQTNGRAEFRAGYTAGWSEAVERAAKVDKDGADPKATGAAEFCVGLVSRSFASAEVKGMDLSPGMLARIGRSLMLRGNFVAAIETANGVELLPAATYDITGGVAPSSWNYALSLASPSGMEERTLAYAGIVHCRINETDNQPWLGCSPLANAGLSADLLGNLERRMGQESNARAGYLLPVPDGMPDETIDALKADLAALKGGVALVETTSGGAGQGRQSAPFAGDWTPKRFGVNFPAGNVEARRDVGTGIVAAMGVPPLLWAGGDGGALRESYRHALHTLITPLGLIVAAELSAKLEREISLDFGRLAAADIASKARAYHSFVQAGMDPAEALLRSGLET